MFKVDGLPLILLIVLLAPYIPNVLPWISCLGLLAFVGLVLGYFYHHPGKQPRIRKRGLPNFSVPVPQYGFVSFVSSLDKQTEERQDALQEPEKPDWEEPPLKTLQRTLSTACCQLGLKLLGEPAFETLAVRDPEAHSKALLTRLLQPKAQIWARLLTDWYVDQKRSHFEAKLWIQLWTLILEFVKHYKRLRREVLKENLSGPEARRVLLVRKANSNVTGTQTSAKGAPPINSSSNLSKGGGYGGDLILAEKEPSSLEYYQQHLDDFNEATDDEGMAPWEFTDSASSPDSTSLPLPRDSLDELNAQVALRMAALGLLHPAVGNGDQEKEYIRLIIDQIWGSWRLGQQDGDFPKHEESGRQNSLLRVLSREVLTSQFIWPLIEKWTQPDFLNQFLLDKVNEQTQRHLVTQKVVKNFRSQLDVFFVQFPPKFMIMNSQKSLNANLTLGQKYRYFEIVAKFAKKCTSLLDLNAIRHQILLEMRKRLEEAKDIQKSDAMEQLKRYLKGLDALRLKYEKRIAVLTFDDDRITERIPSQNPTSTQPEFSLRSLLEECHSLGSETAAETSPSLFYFLDFLEQRNEKTALPKIKFWLAAARVRRMHAALFIEKDPESPVSAEAEEALEKEVSKIYKSFLVAVGAYPPLIEVEDSKTMRIVEEHFVLFNPDSLSRVCKAILKIQDLIFDELKDEFNAFLESDSYFGLATELQNVRRSQEALADIRQGVAWVPEKSPKKGSPKRANSPLKEKAPNRPSIIQAQLYSELERECARLTGSKISKDGDHLAQDSYVNIHDILDPDTIAKLDTDFFEDDAIRDLTGQFGESLAPGQLLLSSTKLQQVKEDLDRVLLELDCLNLLQAQVLPPLHIMKTPLQLMELHILEQTQDVLKQEVSDLTHKKFKFESQEQREAIVPGACTVRIKRVYDDMVTDQNERKRVTFYEIVVQKEIGMRRWTVRRRYSDFHTLNRKLKDKFPIVNEFDLPAKTLSIFHSKMGREELKKERMSSLERYLQRLIDNPNICQSDELRTFLSTSEYKTRHFRSVQSIMESEATIAATASNTLKSGAHKLAKLMETAGRKGLHFTSFKKKKEDRKLSKKKSKSPLSDTRSDTPTSPDKNAVANLKREEADEDDQESSSEELWGASDDEESRKEGDTMAGSVGILADPVCSLVLEFFEFKEQDTYLKRNASAMLLKQYLGGRLSLEHEIASLLNEFTNEEHISRVISRQVDRYLSKMESSKFKSTPTKGFDDIFPRVPTNTRNEARAKFVSVCPESFSRFLGQETAATGVSRIFDMFQHSTLNRHLIFTLADAILQLVLQELTSPS